MKDIYSACRLVEIFEVVYPQIFLDLLSTMIGRVQAIYQAEFCLYLRTLTPPKLLGVRARNLARLIMFPGECHQGVGDVIMTS